MVYISLLYLVKHVSFCSWMKFPEKIIDVCPLLTSSSCSSSFSFFGFQQKQYNHYTIHKVLLNSIYNTSEDTM